MLVPGPLLEEPEKARSSNYGLGIRSRSGHGAPWANSSPISWHGPVNTHKVRIAGIDAPENKQPFGTASKDNLSRLAFKRDVEARCYKRDRYGREVCRVYQGAGMAWHFKPTQERPVYRDEEGGREGGEANAEGAKVEVANAAHLSADILSSVGFDANAELSATGSSWPY